MGPDQQSGPDLKSMTVERTEASAESDSEDEVYEDSVDWNLGPGDPPLQDSSDRSNSELPGDDVPSSPPFSG